MITREYPSISNLAQMRARLRATSQRNETDNVLYLDRLELLFSATASQDWKIVAEVTGYLAAIRPDFVNADVVRSAKQVSRELQHESASGRPPKHLTNLLAACRRLRNG